jgi:hypothetical protein
VPEADLAKNGKRKLPASAPDFFTEDTPVTGAYLADIVDFANASLMSYPLCCHGLVPFWYRGTPKVRSRY